MRIRGNAKGLKREGFEEAKSVESDLVIVAEKEVAKGGGPSEPEKGGIGDRSAPLQIEKLERHFDFVKSIVIDGTKTEVEGGERGGFSQKGSAGLGRKVGT